MIEVAQTVSRERDVHVVSGLEGLDLDARE